MNRLPRPLCLALLAVLTTSPAWANYSWGQMGNFRPGIQAAIVALVLAVEWLVIRLFSRMSWLASLLAVAGANAVSGLMGYMLLGQLKLTDYRQLFSMVIPSVILEALVIVPCAGSLSARPAQRGEWAFIGLIVANCLSAVATFGFLQLNYGPTPQPILGREGWAMAGAAGTLRRAASTPERSLRDAIRQDRSRYLFRITAPRQKQAFLDVAPPWVPWSQRRWVTPYETGEIPEKLAPEGQGRPMVWTGAPYLQSRRAVVFSDGSSRFVTEREFQQLGAVPRPPPPWLIELLKQEPAHGKGRSG